MKNYIIYLLSIFTMLLLLACDRGGEFELGNNTLALTFSCSNITRADDSDVDALNENKIVSLDCFFYAASPNATTADFNAPSLAHRRISSINAIGQHTTYISFEEEEIADIFVDVTGRTNSTCFIYVIANRPESVALPATPAGPTINQLKALVVESDFRTYTTPQSSFFMDSEGNDVVTLTINNNGTKTLSGEVELRRTAAKISFSISKFGLADDNDEVEINGKTYTPNYEGIYVIFDKCVYKSHIAPDVVSNDNINDRYCDVGSDKEDDDNADGNEGNNGIIRMVTTDGHAPCTLSMPFYSYPSDWNATEENDACISLVVPWKAVDEDIYKPYHYKVPINPDKDKLERNIHYKISVQISMLGTLDPDQAVEIAPSYVIFDCLNWNNDEMETIITDFRYLMVEENSYVLNNVNTIEIPYWTSHPCKIVGAKITQADIKTGDDKTISNPESYITLEDDKIIYSKVLDNNYMSETFDFTPYTIEFTIQHITESTKYQEKIIITQYPAIYGDYEENSEYIDEGSNNNASHYTWVNGYYSTSQNNHSYLNNQDFFASCTGLYSGFSPNMYVFTVTSVEGTDYVIGDPRTTEIDTKLVNASRVYRDANNTTGAAWVTAKALYNGAQNRKLQYYYPTDVDYTSDETMKNSRTENMIAPKFRIASGYAVLYTSNDNNHPTRDIEGMKKRCASYQEDGYPAGRWRLPTKAEFEFIFSQVRAKKLPKIYDEGSNYWCAHGIGHCEENSSIVTLTYTTTSNPGLSVRCVYDDWYWGSEPVLTTNDDKKIFTWGDIPRSAKADAPAIKY